MSTSHHNVSWGSINLAAMNRLSSWDRFVVTVTLIAVVMWVFSPHAVVASTTKSPEPLVFEIENFPTVEFVRVLPTAILPIAEVQPEPQVDPRVAALREYLESKRSPLVPHAETLLNHYHYRLIIAIAFAESNFCRRNIMPYNCWGIGGGQPVQYQDYPHAIASADRLIQKYFANGLVNPTYMRDRWVGWENDNWIVAVEQVAHELEDLGI